MLRLLLLCVFFIWSSVSTVIINEVADQGTATGCSTKKADWVELHNTGSSTVDLAGFKLHDNNGPSDSTAYTFPTTKLEAGKYLVLCRDGASTSPQFKIGGDDTITLRDKAGAVVSTSGTLPNKGDYGLTWARNGAKFEYTSTPTPGKVNKFTTRSSSAVATVIISEVADKGTSEGACNKADWIELHNTGSSPVDIAGFKLHDSQGPGDKKAFIFPAASKILGKNYLVLCTRQTKSDGSAAAMSPQFKIAGDDKITLRNAVGEFVSTSGTLPNKGEYGLTWAYNSAKSAYEYTSTPTPGKVNTITASWPTVRARLAKQHTDGEAFFEQTSGALPALVEIHLTMSANDWKYQQANASYEVYKPFTGLKVTSNDGATTHADLSAGGRARPRGQSTLQFPVCMGNKNVPWLVDVTAGSDRNQRLFGMERFYLRNHLMDPSYMREWSMHRMLRRFDLPYLRTRTAKLYVNKDYRGLYEVMEAPDQEYVFYRNFGVDKTNAASTKPPFADGHVMYKVKTQSRNCGEQNYKNNPELAGVNVSSLLSVPTKAKHYAFKRGEHRPRLGVHKDLTVCGGMFGAMMTREMSAVLVSWTKKDKNCGKTFLDNGLIDRDIGGSDKSTNDNDKRMESFINTYMSGPAWKGCRKGDACDSKTGIYATFRNDPKVDVDQWLKNFAVYAVTVGTDSPIGIGNNYFLASPGGATEAERAYRMVQYDHNLAGTLLGNNLCGGSCMFRGPYWSITRPTCRGLADHYYAGPLLAGTGNAENMKKYLAHVKAFNENVYTNAEVIAEMEKHASAIKSAVKEDPGAKMTDLYTPTFDASFFDKELTTTSGTAAGYNLLAFMKARGEEVKKQLAAIDDGTFPRLPDKVPSEEVCQDWRLDKSPNMLSGKFVVHDTKCPAMAAPCRQASFCFDEGGMCDAMTGDFRDKTFCPKEVKTHCKGCFPHSVCGTSATTLARVLVVVMLLAAALGLE